MTIATLTADTVDAAPAGRHRQPATPRSRVESTLTAAAFLGSFVSMLALLVVAGTAIATVDGAPPADRTTAVVQVAR